MRSGSREVSLLSAVQPIALILLVMTLFGSSRASEAEAQGKDDPPGCAHAYVACEDVEVDGGLSAPCSKPRGDYERELYTWLNSREYQSWEHDAFVRDTGPFILGSNYGTHPAVRIYYSPKAAEWVKKDRKGTLETGAVIVKEMFPPPAARYEGVSDLDAHLESWTLMIKDDQTCDGWFWANPSPVSRSGKTVQEYEEAIAATTQTSYGPPFNFPDAEYGQPSCLRCHATSTGDSTFADEENFDTRGIQFRVDNSWRYDPGSSQQGPTNLPAEQRPGGGEDEGTLFLSAFHHNPADDNTTPNEETILSTPLTTPNQTFLKYFQLGPGKVEPQPVRPFPGQWADHVPAAFDGAEQFITSDNCVGCHGGLGGAPSGITMFLQTGPNYGDGYNIAPFGEWRWSPMGLAGRDPFFYSQLATELAILDQEFKEPDRSQAKEALVNTCLSCHGAMGQRQLLIDAREEKELDPLFQRDYIYTFTALTAEQESQPNYEYHKYGNLARDGISCTVCHHIDPPPEWAQWEKRHPGQEMPPNKKEEDFLFNWTTGQFPYSPRDELNGPFKNVIEKPMQNALGITPVHNSFIQDSRMCGTCHTINLPNVDLPCDPKSSDPVKGCRDALDRSAQHQAKRLDTEYGVDYAGFLADNFQHSIEQATYLEWKNSDFSQIDNPSYQSCQDCHMPRDFKSLDWKEPGGLHIEQLSSQIASIQDTTYPEVANSLGPDDLFVPVRDDYRRHELVGLNVFLVEMFNQFDPILGIDEQDPMTYATNGDRFAIENMLVQGQNDTVHLDVDIVSLKGRKLTADVSVESLVGHRFPSGVAFRRAWLQFEVLDNTRGGEVIWASGRTNEAGLIVEGLGDEPLATEFFSTQRWQPHYHGIPEKEGASLDSTWKTSEHCVPKEGPPVKYGGPITRPDQVQIYEEVTWNGSDEVTFSFIHRDTHCKDNRLLPRGYRTSQTFDGEILQEFMEATDPVEVAGDPDYTEGHTGRDRLRYAVELPHSTDDVSVRVTMNSQSFQPFWFKRKFELSGHDPATQRLYYMSSHLRTQGTVINNWTLPLVTCTKAVGAEEGTGCR